MLCEAMLLALAALLAAAGTERSAVLPAGNAWIVATIAHSEWCPAGNVRLDLRSGRYALTARAPHRTCGDPGLERPVVAGRLDPPRLETIRRAYERVLAEGLESPDCRNGRQPDRIVVSNGGTPILVVVSGAMQGSAPDSLTCWSDAANDLHALLDDSFPAASAAR
jgi:hypothetical protein